MITTAFHIIGSEDSTEHIVGGSPEGAAIYMYMPTSG